jgi:hypothetical protein
MKTGLKFSMLALALMFGTSLTAHANDHGFNPPSAPEVDPSLAISGLALLGGTLTVLRSKLRSK